METLKQYKKLKNNEKTKNRPDKDYFQFDGTKYFSDFSKQN